MKWKTFLELHIQAVAKVRSWVLGAVTLTTVLPLGEF